MKCATVKHTLFLEDDLEKVADTLNKWFDAHPSVQVRHITQFKGTYNDEFILTTIYYE